MSYVFNFINVLKMFQTEKYQYVKYTETKAKASKNCTAMSKYIG